MVRPKGRTYDVSPFCVSSVEAACMSACCKTSGNALPLRLARRRMPEQAVALKKYFGATSVSKTSDNEHTAAALGHSEILRVKYPPADAIPQFDQPPKDGSEITSSV